MQDRLIVSREEFCRLAGGIGKTLAYAYIAAGKVDVVKLGQRTFITYESIERLIERNTVGQAD